MAKRKYVWKRMAPSELESPFYPLQAPHGSKDSSDDNSVLALCGYPARQFKHAGLKY